jgi:hypothetical protein
MIFLHPSALDQGPALGNIAARGGLFDEEQRMMSVWIAAWGLYGQVSIY